jgi:hypothetical protein
VDRWRATLPLSRGLTLMMTLRALVERYNTLPRKAGDAVALADFGLTPEETVKLFNSLDEDYHISRHLHFSKGDGKTYTISGEAVTHVAIDAAISNLL